MATGFNLRVVISANHIIEVYSYEKVLYKDFESSGGRTKKTGKDVLKNRKDSTYRARERVRRLASANFSNKDKFLTLTFAENETDIQKCNAYFKNFIKRLKYKTDKKDLKYIAVVEFQKRGAVHYHVLLNLPYYPIEQISRIWGAGFCKINKISHVDNIGAYMVKYMTKNITDSRLQGQKSYLCSRGLKRPEVLTGIDASKFLDLYCVEDRQAVFESSFTNEFTGKVEYKEYNLKRC